MDVLNSSVATRLTQARRQQQGGEAQGGVGNGGGVQQGAQGRLMLVLSLLELLLEQSPGIRDPDSTKRSPSFEPLGSPCRF